MHAVILRQPTLICGNGFKLTPTQPQHAYLWELSVSVENIQSRSWYRLDIPNFQECKHQLDNESRIQWNSLPCTTIACHRTRSNGSWNLFFSLNDECLLSILVVSFFVMLVPFINVLSELLALAWHWNHASVTVMTTDAVLPGPLLSRPIDISMSSTYRVGINTPTSYCSASLYVESFECTYRNIILNNLKISFEIWRKWSQWAV